MTKPTIVLVPGAWHTPSHYESLLVKLREAGYSTKSEKLSSVGSSQPLDQTAALDATTIGRDLLQPELDLGKDVILVMHSYGGSPGAAASKGNSKTERAAAGKEGGIIGLIFVCAFLANEGDSLKSKLPGQELDPWCIIDEKTGQVDVEKPKDVFYSETDEASATTAIQKLELQALAALSTPSPPSAWPDNAFDGRRAYVLCHLDKAIPYPAQKAMVDYSGVDWQTLDLQADHSPFISHVEPLSTFIQELSQSWTS